VTPQAKTRLVERAVAALLSKPTIRAAARECGVSSRTLQRVMKQPEFESAYRDARRALVREATAKLTANSGRAAEVLRRVFDDRKATPGARVAAATQTIRLTLESYEIEELDRRIRALEEQKNNASL
jgi:DNA-binding MurR/RpiR family transcriptional regulator